jgi:hypothetical protein
MRIRVERSGGLAGISFTKEMDAKDLPSAQLRTAKKIIEDKKVASLSMKSSPAGAADHYNYKISVQDGMNQKVIECNQYNIQADLKSLVKYIEKNSNPKINTNKIGSK